MRSILLLVLGILSHQIIHAQWTTQASNTSFNLNDVFFITDDIGTAVGDNGRIMSTIDGGILWAGANDIPACNLNSIYFTTPDSGWIASTCGIHFTNDGGQNWSLQTPGNGEELHDIYFYNSQFGWAVGDKLTIMRTTDGGNNWTVDTLNSLLPNNPLLAVYFKDQNNGWIGGGEKLHFTTDGGQNWTLGNSLLIDWIYSIDFGDDLAGVATGMGGSTTNTFDWGNTWNFSGSVTPNNKHLQGVHFSSLDSVYMVGEDGLIYFSNNSGSSWTMQNSGVTENLNSVYFPSADIGYAVGDAGTILKYGQALGDHSDHNSSDTYRIYPNPANDVLIIEVYDFHEYPLGSICLRNSIGQEIPIATTYLHGKVQVDVVSLTNGIYILEITGEKRTQISSLVIKQ